MKSINLFYSVEMISKLLSIHKTNVNYIIRRLKLQPDFDICVGNGFVRNHYSLEKLNQIAKFGTKTENFDFLQSKINSKNETKTTIFESKINNEWIITN